MNMEMCSARDVLVDQGVGGLTIRTVKTGREDGSALSRTFVLPLDLATKQRRLPPEKVEIAYLRMRCKGRVVNHNVDV